MSSQQKICKICGQLNGSLPYHYHSKHSYCDQCQESFGDRAGIINHLIQDHHKKLKCDFCHIQTLTEAILEQHIIRKHQSTAASKSLKKFQCPICPFVAKYMNILQKHVETKHARASSIPTYRCHLCRYVTRDKDGFHTHMKLEHKSVNVKDIPNDDESDESSDEIEVVSPPNKKAKIEDLPSPNEVCMICQVGIDDEVHYQIEHQDCCQTNFKSANDVIEHHAIVHLQRNIYQCNLCDYYGFTVESVQTHRDLSHDSEVKYMCGDCELIFDSEPILLAHAKEVHPELEVKVE